MATVELTNMCMIESATGQVLVQRRVKSWPGIAFPGGHVEDGEGIVDSVIREVREETGLTVTDLRPLGVKHRYSPDNADRFMVFLYAAGSYSGTVQSSDEGEVFWVDKDKLLDMDLARSMSETLEAMMNPDVSELSYIRTGSGDDFVETTKMQ